MKKTVAILIVNYNGRDFLPNCLESVFETEEEGVIKKVYLVDNLSTDDSIAWVKENYPQVHLIYSSYNSGYAGGNNLGWEHIKKTDADYLYLLNQDAQLTDNCLTTLVQYLDNHEEVVSGQPKIMLYPEKDKINSLGNIIHFLGFGYASYEGLKETQVEAKSGRINYVSGSNLMIKRSYLEKYGKLFDDFMFMYLEDLDFGWQIMLSGYQSHLVEDSKVFHQYEFQRSIKQVYWFERNRLYIVWKNYKLLTLLLLLPAGLFMELGQLFFAIQNGSLSHKLKSYLWFLNPLNVLKLVKDHIQTQKRRTVTDRFILQEFTGVIDFQPLDNPLLKYIANPVFKAYLSILRFIVRW